MNRQEKQAFIEAMKARLMENPGGLFLADFRGVTVAQDLKVRAALRDAGVEMKVVKNRLFKLALQGTPYEGLLEDMLTGPNAVLVVDDVVAGARALRDIKKANDEISLTVKGGALAGTSLSVEDVEKLASLPSREQLLGTFVALLQTPLRNFASLLNAPLRDFVGVVKALEDKKSASA